MSRKNSKKQIGIKGQKQKIAKRPIAKAALAVKKPKKTGKTKRTALAARRVEKAKEMVEVMLMAKRLEKKKK